MRHFLKRWSWRLLLTTGGFALIYLSWLLLHIVYWEHYNPHTSAFMQARLEELRQTHPDAKLRHQWVNYEDISVHLKRAIIASEDSQFLKHGGFDFDSIMHALEKNIEQRKWSAGGSTISQQLAKNLFLSDKKTISRKLEEAMITIMLESILSKRRILEIYMNIIEWGHDVFGAEAAAQHYFGVSASVLTGRQAAFLASTLPNPRYYERNRQAEKLIRKRDIIHRRMPLAQVP